MKITEEFIASVKADHEARGVTRFISEQLLNELRYRLESERIQDALASRKLDPLGPDGFP